MEQTELDPKENEEMTNAEKKQFLSQYYKARLRIKIIREQIEELETLAAGGAINISDMPKGKNHNYDPVKENAVKIGDLITELEEIISEADETCATVVNAVNTVEDPDEHAVLSLRYVNCKRWEDIADQLGYSEIRMYQIHDKALDSMQISKDYS